MMKSSKNHNYLGHPLCLQTIVPQSLLFYNLGLRSRIRFNTCVKNLIIEKEVPSSLADDCRFRIARISLDLRNHLFLWHHYLSRTRLVAIFRYRNPPLFHLPLCRKPPDMTNLFQKLKKTISDKAQPLHTHYFHTHNRNPDPSLPQTKVLFFRSEKCILFFE